MSRDAGMRGRVQARSSWKWSSAGAEGRVGASTLRQKEGSRNRKRNNKGTCWGSNGGLGSRDLRWFLNPREEAALPCPRCRDCLHDGHMMAVTASRDRGRTLL